DLVPPAALKFRELMKASYREFHFLSLALPQAFSPTAAFEDLALWQEGAYGGRGILKKLALAGVRLNPGRIKRKGPLEGAASFLNRASFFLANGSEPFEAFREDAVSIASIMEGAGMRPLPFLSPQERREAVRLMTRWWMPAGAGAAPAVALFDHVHLFRDASSALEAQGLYSKGISCGKWGRGHYAASLNMVDSTDFDGQSPMNPENLWLARFLRSHSPGGGPGLAVSVRGQVEPPSVTGAQIRKNFSALNDEERRREKKDIDSTGVQEEMARNLSYGRTLYSSSALPPSLVNVSACLFSAGHPKEARPLLNSLSPLSFAGFSTAKEQVLAFQSMQVASPVRFSPFELHWSSSVLAGSGISSLSYAGDGRGALLGFTEADRQPVFLDSAAVQDKSLRVYTVILGSTGSGKTMALLSLAFQWSKILREGGKTPVVFIDPKQDSDFSEAVSLMGGKTLSMDSDISSGMLDPLCAYADGPREREAALDTSVCMLYEIFDPACLDPDLEIDLRLMIDFGMKRGARSLSDALCLAAEGEGERLPGRRREILEKVEGFASTSRSFRLLYGKGRPVQIRLSEGLSLIRAGRMDVIPRGDGSSTARVKQWVLRMLVVAAGIAASGRDGMICLDEAWMALEGKSSSILAEWGRLARSLRFTPVLSSQRVQEFADSSLESFIQRGILLSLSNSDALGKKSEARNALDLLRVEDEEGRIARRLSEDGEIGLSRAPNWRSLKALRGADGKLLRGSVAYFVDGSRSPVPVEVAIPEKLLALIGTSRLER
ncbi:MAG: hypothetical protein IKT06_02065, partial [Aeriscardovia sp.]|nr:hypothetical protein [Aeriscardovia sp.]